jgi:hypothetical protein
MSLKPQPYLGGDLVLMSRLIIRSHLVIGSIVPFHAVQEGTIPPVLNIFILKSPPGNGI